MCDLHKHFILCSCKLPGDKAASEGDLTWRLSSYQGESPLLIEGLYRFPDYEIAGAFPSEWVADQLNARNCFDFEMEPSELDELRILKPMDAKYPSQYISFVYRGGRWVANDCHAFEALTQLKEKGKVLLGERSRLNTVRQFLQSQKEQWLKKDDARFGFSYLLMREFEQFTAEELELEPDIETLVDLAVGSAAGLLRGAVVDPAHLKETKNRLLQAIQSPKLLPELPYRRTLSVAEHENAWKRLQDTLLNGNRPRFMFHGDEAVAAWQADMMAKECMLLFLHELDGRSSYRLSSLWVEEMIGLDCGFWVNEGMTWGLQREGHGYWYELGPQWRWGGAAFEW